MAKREERLKAIELRKQGLATTEIIKRLGVARSTVMSWCRDVELTEEQLLKIKGKGRLKHAQKIKAKKNKRRQEQIDKGAQDIQSSTNELLLIGASLYWAEGGKTSESVQFSNSDPDMIRVAIKWLLECLKAPTDRLRFQLHIHKGLDEDKTKEFWKENLKNLVDIKDYQWYKTQIKKSSIGHRKHMLYKGTFYVSFHERSTFWYVEGLIEGLKQRIMAPKHFK